MSTTDTTLGQGTGNQRSADERTIALGTGLIRLADRTYLRPVNSDVSVRCLGPLAYWSVTSRFLIEADLETEHEPLFLFPLPSEAALQKVSLGERELLPGPLKVVTVESLGESVPYPNPSPGLLEEFSDEVRSVFSLRLESWSELLSAGSEIEVKLEYADGLPTVDGRVQLRCRTRVEPSLEAIGQTEVKLEVTIDDGDELVDDPISEPPLGRVEPESESPLSLYGTFNADEGDAIVSFRPGRTQMPVTRLYRSDEHFIFSIFPPTSIPASPQRRDLVFAVDASENLDRETFAKIQSDLADSLRTLDENDRFALVTFGREIEGYDGGEFCDIDKVEEAITWLHAIRPQGRADVQPLLQRVQSLPSQEDRQLCIFLLAAGHVGNEPAILKSLDFDQSDRRYYTVGIGPSVKQSFLRRLALLTRGRCEVSPDGDCSRALERLLGQTRALLAEVTFEDLGSTDLDQESLVPSRMTSLTPQGPVHSMGRGAPESIRFRSKDETGVFFAGTANARPTEHPALGSVWAGLKVSELQDSVNLTTGSKRKFLIEEVAELAASHGILIGPTVLVLETDEGPVIQYSAHPSHWTDHLPKEKKESHDQANKGSTPFDWRKGLVARQGLFKGPKGAKAGASSESSSRYGLRSKGGPPEATGKKPRLDRSSSIEYSSSEEHHADPHESLEEPLEENAATNAAEKATSDTAKATPSVAAAASSGSAQTPPSTPRAPEPKGEPAASPGPKGRPSAASPVVAGGHAPVVRISVDPLDEGRERMSAYRSQLESFDTELSLAALQGLPRELSQGGKDLPRILAQTVAHLEKRGFYSQAVSVLGLLMRDNPAPEVVRKMESLLDTWARSLPDEKLPEAIQIATLGRRVCPSSSVLTETCKELYSRWMAVSREQSLLPEVVSLAADDSPDLAPLLSRPQLGLAGLYREQAELGKQMEELREQVDDRMSAFAEELDLDGFRKSVEDQLAAIPQMLEAMVQRVQAATPATQAAAPAASVPTAAPVAAKPAAAKQAAAKSAAAKPVAAKPAAATAAQPAAPAAATPAASAQPTAAAPAESATPESGASENDEMLLTHEEMVEMLLADPRDEEGHAAVRVALKIPRDRINFFRELVKNDKKEPYHSLSLARTYRESDQTKVAVVHYQKYLRANKDPVAYRELADAYDELGKAGLAASARKAAEAYGGG